MVDIGGGTGGGSGRIIKREGRHGAGDRAAQFTCRNPIPLVPIIPSQPLRKTRSGCPDFAPVYRQRAGFASGSLWRRGLYAFAQALRRVMRPTICSLFEPHYKQNLYTNPKRTAKSSSPFTIIDSIEGLIVQIISTVSKIPLFTRRRTCGSGASIINHTTYRISALASQVDQGSFAHNPHFLISA